MASAPLTKSLQKILVPINVISALRDTTKVDENGFQNTFFTGRVTPAPYNVRGNAVTELDLNTQNINRCKIKNRAEIITQA